MINIDNHYKLFQGNCLKIMQKFASSGTTAYSYDIIILFKGIWECLKTYYKNK